MSKEHAAPHPDDPFGFTEREWQVFHVTDARFQDILDGDETKIHDIREAAHSDGKFLFITLSRTGVDEREYITFFGLGFHRQREQWIKDEWFWYITEPTLTTLLWTLSKADTKAIIQERRTLLDPLVDTSAPSERALLFRWLDEVDNEAFPAAADLDA